jgi:PAS domain S-box-containing protein
MQEQEVIEMNKLDEGFLIIFDSNPVGMIISNLETKNFQYVNEVFLTSFGYTRSELVGKTAPEFNLIEPELNEKVLSLLQQQGFAKDIEVLGRKKTGETFWTLASVQVITINNEKFAITSFINIEDRKKAEAELIIANKELAFENEEKEKRAAELVIANKELEFQNKEKEKRAAELALANKKLLESEDSIKKLNQELEQKVAERNEELELINKTILDYKFALDESSIVAVTDQKGTIQFVNDNFCKISKYSKGELIGQDHSIINSNFHSKEYIRDLWVTIANGKVWRGEMKNKAKDGTIYWVDTTIVPFINKEGKPYKYLTIRSDITDRMLYVEEIKANEEKYYDLFENSLAAISTLDIVTHRTLDINETAVKLFGYTSKEDFLQNFDPKIHFVNPADMEDISQTLIKKGIVENKELELKKLDGTRFWVISSGKMNFKNNTVQSVMIDITDRMLYVEELKANEEKYHDLFENSLVPMFITDPKTLKTNDVNDIGIEFFGYKSREDFIENYDSINHFINSTDLERIRKDISEFGIVKWDLVKMKKLNGTPFWAKLTGKLSADNSFVQTALIDITDQVRSQDELEEKVKERTIKLTDSLVREKELHELTSSFVSMASHEFRTPLATILSSASIIEMYKKSEEQENRSKHINRISSTVKNLTDILNDFLSIGELEKNAVAVKNTEINLPEFITTIVEEMQGVVNEKYQHIVFHHQGEVMIKQSEKILKNILLNLLSNASKYSPNENEIDLSSTITNNQVLITVRDYGIGIPEKDQAKLFTLFFRASNAEYIQGTGLGLFIVKKYLELIKGTIEFESKQNEGTTFTITFHKNHH